MPLRRLGKRLVACYTSCYMMIKGCLKLGRDIQECIVGQVKKIIPRNIGDCNKGETIQTYNYGNCRRDFTYVDDIVEGIVRVMKKAPERQTGEDGLPIPPYKVYNIGGGQPENLLDFVQTLQEELVRAEVLPEDYDFDAHKTALADVPTTYADATALDQINVELHGN